jgi:two-component system nitrogen regulation response regulator GlnG
MDRTVLLISSDPDTIARTRKALEPLGFGVALKHRLSSGLRAMKGGELLVLDLPEPAPALREIKSYHPEATVLVAAHTGCRGTAMEEGAYFCLEKPLNPAELRAATRNAFSHMRLREELDLLRRKDPTAPMLGSGPRLQRVLKQIEKAARQDVPVLISGEPGTGKALAARAIHDSGPRRGGPFITVSALPEALEEALFGGGQAPGAIAGADAGTLFISSLYAPAPSLRDRLAMFLRGDKALNGAAPDARVICAANGSLKKDPLLACFGAVISLPPLRDHPEDILPLAGHFLSTAALAYGRGEKAFTKEARKALKDYPWPGNMEELRRAVTIACLTAEGPQVEARHLGSALGNGGFSIKDFLEAKLGRFLKDLRRLRRPALHDTVLTEVEKALIELVLKETGGNQVKTASALGINRTTLRTKIKSYRISVKQK